MDSGKLSRIGSWLADFRHRFSPAVAVRLATRGLDNIPKTIEISKTKLDEEYRAIISGLDNTFPEISFRKSISHEDAKLAEDVLEKLLGFRLVMKDSQIVGAGRGIFVSSGTISAGKIASVYPGTIYDPWDPIFFQSIGNHFVLKCQDGILIDGNDCRLSARIHRSCVRRDLSPDISDLTWLTRQPFNFLNAGQYVNNGSASHNVQYIDLDIINWPLKKEPFPGDEVLIPDEPTPSTINPSTIPPVPSFDKKLIRHLESLSLVRFQDEYAVSTLREAVARANRLHTINELEPMYTVWEEQDCKLHEDIPEEPLSVKEVLKNAARTVEDYFVTPPGNIPLEESTKPLDISLINEWDKRGVAVIPKPRKIANQG